MRKLIVVLGLAAAGCGGHHTPYRPVTPAALRRAIAHSGLRIRWRDGRAGGDVVADLAGEARGERGRGRIAFELAVTRGKADLHVLGRAHYPLRYDPESRSPLILHEGTEHEIDPSRAASSPTSRTRPGGSRSRTIPPPPGSATASTRRSSPPSRPTTPKRTLCWARRQARRP